VAFPSGCSFDVCCPVCTPHRFALHLLREGIVRQIGQPSDGRRREITPAGLHVCRAKPVEMGVKEALPAAQTISGFWHGELADFDGVGKFIEVECAIRSTIGGTTTSMSKSRTR
jgi:hypothetical protein